MPSETAKSTPLSAFSDPVRRWFEASFAEPTPAQAMGWPPIAAGANTLICAPTGSGKTLAAFLWGIDRLSRRGPSGLGPGRADRLRVAAQGPLLRHRAQPARAAEGSGGRDHGGPADGRHPAARPPGDASQAARHPGHDPGVPLPDHDLGSPGDPHGRGGGDRRRDPRSRAVEAGCAPGAHPGAALAPGDLERRRRTFNGLASRLPSDRWSGSLASWSGHGANARSPTPASRRSSTWRSGSQWKT